MNLGIFHPFSFFDSIEKCTASHHTALITFVINGSAAVKLVAVDGTESNPAVATVTTYTVNDISYTRTYVNHSLQVGDNFVVKITVGSDTYYDGRYVFQDASCQVFLQGISECADQNFQWTTQTPLHNFINAEFDIPEYASTEIDVVTDGIDVQRSVELRQIQKLVATAPKGYYSLLQSYKTFETIKVEGKEVVNWSVEKSEIDDDYDTFTMSFEYATANDNACCELINIDTVVDAVPSGLSVVINNVGGILTPSVTGDNVSGLSYQWFRNGVLVADTATLQPSGPANYEVIVTNSTSEGVGSTSLVNACTAISIDISQVGNVLDANILNQPSGSAIKVYLGTTEVATALPYTITQGGVYFVEVVHTDCTKRAGIDAVFIDETEVFTVSITQSGSVLTAVTDATTPAYQWELEEANGVRNPIGTQVTQTLGATGVYHLTVTSSGVSNSTYYFHVNTSENIDFIHAPYRLVDQYLRASGHQFTPVQIDTSKVNNPAIQLEVKRSGNVLHHVSGTPSEVDEYTINVSGQYEVWSIIPLNNEDLIIKLN